MRYFHHYMVWYTFIGVGEKIAQSITGAPTLGLIGFLDSSGSGVGPSDAAIAMTDNLLGPLQAGAGSVFGGGLIGAVASFVIDIAGFAFTVPFQITAGGPPALQLLAFPFFLGFILSIGTVLRGTL